MHEMPAPRFRAMPRRAGLRTVAFLAVAVTAFPLSEGWAQPYRYKASYLDQGWRADERQQFYYTSQGSQIIPYDWFLALEQPAGKKPFNDPEFMNRLGYLPMPKDKDRNPDGLPVGFVKDENRLAFQVKRTRLAKGVDKTAYPAVGKWMGLTCAACHTNRIEHKGKSLVLDGGP